MAEVYRIKKYWTSFYDSSEVCKIDRISYLNKGGLFAVNNIKIITKYLFIFACNWFT